MRRDGFDRLTRPRDRGATLADQARRVAGIPGVLSVFDLSCGGIVPGYENRYRMIVRDVNDDSIILFHAECGVDELYEYRRLLCGDDHDDITNEVHALMNSGFDVRDAAEIAGRINSLPRQGAEAADVG